MTEAKEVPTMTKVLTLDRLNSGRDSAEKMVAALGDIDGADVVIDARANAAAAPSFCSQLVVSTLYDRHANTLTLVDGSKHVAEYVTDSAEHRGLSDRLDVRADMPDTASAPATTPVMATVESVVNFDGEGCAPPSCSCPGHRFPGVHHMVACCDQPHVD